VSGAELVAVADAGVLASRTPAELKQWMATVKDMLLTVLEAGVDYGYLPKVDKPVLLQPGAQKLALLADLGTETERVAWEPGPTGEMGATYKTTVTRANGRRVQVERYAGYDENQFLAVNSNGVLRYRAPWDTVVAMAQKRAFVAGVKAALGLSGLFADLDRDDDKAAKGAKQSTGAGSVQAPVPGPSSVAPVAGTAAPGSRRPVEQRRRRDEVPTELYDNLPEAQ
jgi:hypothetical protein